MRMPPQLGRCHIQTWLDQGTTSLARATGPRGDVVELRCFRCDRPGQAVDPSELLAELQPWTRVEHPALPEILDLFQDGAWVVVVHPPPPLGYQRLASLGRVDCPRALSLAHQLAAGVAALHAAGLHHGELTAETVQVNAADQVRLSAPHVPRLTRAPLDDHARPIRVDPDLGWFPPERAQRGVVALDARSDVHGLGAVLYHLLSGQRPFPGRDPAELRQAICKTMPPPLTRLRKDVPRVIQALIDKSLAKDPSDRYADAAAFLAVLSQGLENA